MYTSAPSIVIRAFDNSDPTAVGYEEVEIANKAPDAGEAPVGEGVEDITYTEQATKLGRRRFSFACMQMYVHSGQGSKFQTQAVLQKLRRLWRTYGYVWFYEVHANFGDATPSPWAEQSGNDALVFASTHGTTSGIMPSVL